MKKIIDGFRYDTEKADKVCDIREANPRDFKHIDAALYRTKRSGRIQQRSELGRSLAAVGEKCWHVFVSCLSVCGQKSLWLPRQRTRPHSLKICWHRV